MQVETKRNGSRGRRVYENHELVKKNNLRTKTKLQVEQNQGVKRKKITEKNEFWYRYKSSDFWSFWIDYSHMFISINRFFSTIRIIHKLDYRIYISV